MKGILEKIEYAICHVPLFKHLTFAVLYSSHIQQRVQISKELHQRKLGEEATKGQELIRNVHRVSMFTVFIAGLT